MTALEVTAGDEAAGAHSVGCVKGVTGEAVCNGESGQEAAVVFDGHAWTVAYGDSRFPTHSQRTRMDGARRFAGKRRYEKQTQVPRSIETKRTEPINIPP